MVVFNIDVVVSDKGGGAAGIEKQLERLNKTAEKTRKVTERIGRRVRVGGIKKAKAETDKLGNSVQRVTGLLAGLGITVGVRELIGGFVRLSDTFTNYQNRLKIVTKDTDDLRKVTRELFQIADDTRSAYGATAELFARVSLASKELGKSQSELLTFTKALNQAVILSGASAQEARAGIIQLSQGIASGALRGDELRSVLEQLPKVADTLAKSLGVTRGELRKLGEAGKLTGAKVVDAMTRAAAKLEGEFAQTVPTIGQALTQLENKMIQFVGETNEASGAANFFAASIQFMADNIVVMTAVVGVLIIGLGVMATAAIAATGAFTALAAAAPALGAISVIAAAAAIPLQIQKNLIEETTEAIENQAQAATLSSFGQMGAQLQSLNRELETTKRVFEEGNKTSQVAKNRIDQLNLRIQVLKDSMKESSKAYRENTQDAKNLAKATKLADERFEKSLELSKQFTRERKLQAAVEKELKKVLKETAAEDTEGKIRAQITAQQELLRTQRERTKVIEDIRGPMQERARVTATINQLEKEGLITLKEKTAALAGLKKLDFKLPELPELNFKSGGAVLEEVLKRIRDQAQLTGESVAVTGDKMKQALIAGADGANTLREQVERITTAAKKAGVSSALMGEAINDVLGRTVEETYSDSLDDLNFKLEKNLITQREFNAAVLELDRNGQKAATTFQQGFTAAFDKITAEANDLAAVGEKLVDTFANAAVEAITTFAETGKFSFKDFARSLLADIAKIIIRLLVVKALSTLVGGAAAPAADLATTAVNTQTDTNQGRADGGTVQPGRSFVVGENGPEIFKPEQTGTIVPNGGGNQPAPEVKVSVTNVTDPNEVPDRIDQGDFDENIINVLARNKDMVNGTLQ